MVLYKQTFAAILTALLFVLTSAVFAQEPVKVTRSDNKVILEGKIYYVHIVKAGQTLYSIARAYNVSEKEIMIENPGTTADLAIGQVLKIPSDPASAFAVDTKEIQTEQNRHTLKEGETLYAVSKKYGCTVDDLIRLNPGLDINDIPVGYEIILPPPIEEPMNELSFDEEGYLFHKVKRGETLFSIARYYGVSVREIRSVNRELGWGGPRSGDVLRIPQPTTTVSEIFSPVPVFDDTLKVTEPDTLPSEETYRYTELQEPDHFEERMYKIAYMIPFNYSEMEPLDSLLKGERSAFRRERIREEYKMEMEKPQSVNFLEFLEGSLLAADILTDSGMQVEIKIYDTRRSMERTREILAEPAFSQTDLIIGPFFNFNMELVSEFSKTHRIPMVSPFYSNDTLLQKNPYQFQPTPQYKTEYKQNAAFIGRLYDSNLILVHEGDSSNIEKIAYYKEVLFEELEKYSAVETVMFKEVVISNGNTEGLVHSLNPNMKNLVILPSVDEAFASMVASRLFYELGNYDIELFGSSYWVGFKNIEIDYIHALNLKISHTHWYDYHDASFLDFLRKFRSSYIKEPGSYTRMGYNYGTVGYDLSMYFLSALKRYGPRFILHLNEHNVDAMVFDYRFGRISPSGGYENRNLHYYHFNEQMEVEEIQMPERPPIHQYLRPAGDDPIYFRWSNPDPDTSMNILH
jgi:LysM repeat protein